MDEFYLYDDLDEFHEQQEKKSKELQEFEEKYQESLKTIEELRKENKTLKTNIRCIELGFQSLLDTARAEIRRKDKEIDRLRKVNDDICFRRKAHIKSNNNNDEKPHMVHNSGGNSNPFRCNLIKHNETITKEITIMPTANSGKDESRLETHKRYRDSENNYSNGYKRFRSGKEENDKNYQYSSQECSNHQQIKDDRSGRVHGRESMKEATHKKIDNRNSSRERDEYGKYNSGNIDKSSAKSSESPESYCRRSARSMSKDKLNKKYKLFERNNTKNDRSKYKFSKALSKSPPRKNKYHKEFSRDCNKNNENYRKIPSEKSLKPHEKDLSRKKSKSSKTNLNQDQNKFKTAEHSQKDKIKKLIIEKEKPEIVNISIHKKNVEEGKENKSGKDLIKESSNDVQFEMTTINSNQSFTPRKVDLLNEIFGKSPRSAIETDFITNSNFIINNRKGTLKKSTEIEVISSATTSPGDYTDLNSSMSTPVSKTTNILKSDSNKSDSFMNENNYEKSVKHFQSKRREIGEIDECFIPTQDKQRTEPNDSTDLINVVEDDIANELEFLQIPGLDLCPQLKQTKANANKNTLIEIEENTNCKEETETTINKVPTQRNEETIAKGLKAKATKILEIEAADKKQDTSNSEDSQVVDNVFHYNKHSEKRNVENNMDIINLGAECRIENTKNPIQTSKAKINNNFKVVTENLVELSQKQNSTPKIAPNEKIVIKDISQNLTNDIVVVETFNCGGMVPLKNPYNSYNTTTKNKQQLEITEYNEMYAKPELALKSKENKDENNLPTESTNSITAVDDRTSPDKSIDFENATGLFVEASTDIFSENVPINSVLNEVEKSFALLTQDGPKDAENKKENPPLRDSLQKICSSNSNVNTTIDEKLSGTAQEADTELPNKFNNNVESLKESKMSVKESILNAKESFDKILNKAMEQIESIKPAVLDGVLTMSVLQPDQTNVQNIHKTQNPKSSTNELSYSDKDKQSYPFTTVQQGPSFNQSQKSDFNEKQATLDEIVDQEISDRLVKKKSKHKGGQSNVKESTTEKMSVIDESLNFPKNDKAVNNIEANVARTRASNSKQFEHLINNEKELKSNKSHIGESSKETKSIVEKSLDKVLILENIKISKPGLQSIKTKNQNLFTAKISHALDSKNLCELGTAEILQTKSKNSLILETEDSSHLSEESKSEAEVLANEFDIKKEAPCKKETSEEVKSLNKENLNDEENTSFSKIQTTTSKLSEKSSNAFEVHEKEVMVLTTADTEMANNLTNNKVHFIDDETLEVSGNASDYEKILEDKSHVKGSSMETQSVTDESLKSLKDDQVVEASKIEASNEIITAVQLLDNWNNHEQKLKESKSHAEEASIETKSVVEESLTSPKDEKAVFTNNEDKMKESMSNDEQVSVQISIVEENLTSPKDNEAVFVKNQQEASVKTLTVEENITIVKDDQEVEVGRKNGNNKRKISVDCAFDIEEVSVETKSIIEESISYPKEVQAFKEDGKICNNVRNITVELRDSSNKYEENLKESKSYAEETSMGTKLIVEENLTSLKDNEVVFTNNEDKMKESMSNIKEVEENLSALKDVQAVEVFGEETNNKRISVIDCQSHDEEVSVKTISIIKESPISPQKVQAVEVGRKKTNNIINTAIDNCNNDEEKLNKINLNVKEASMETESIVKEGTTDNRSKIVEVCGKEANMVVRTAGKLAVKHNEKKLDRKSPSNGASMETKSIAEESLTSTKDDEVVFATNDDKRKENISGDTKSTHKQILASSKDSQIIEVNGKETNNVKITTVDYQPNAIAPSVEIKSDGGESLDKIQTAANIELSISISTDSISESERKLAETKECKLETVVLRNKEHNSSLKTKHSSQSLEEINVNKPVPIIANEKTSNQICDIKSHGAKVSNENKFYKDSNLIKITDPETSSNLINIKEKTKKNQLHVNEAPIEIKSTIEQSLEYPKDKDVAEESEKNTNFVRIIDQGENLKESNMHVKEAPMETNLVHAEITENVEVPKRVHSDDELQSNQTIEKTHQKVISDTTSTIENLPENKANNSVYKQNGSENKEMITDSTIKEKADDNSLVKTVPEHISTNISKNRTDSINCHSTLHNIDSGDKKTASTTLTKVIDNEIPILAPIESVTLEEHINETSAKMLKLHSKETTASYQNDETKTKPFLTEDSKRKTLLLDSYCSQTFKSKINSDDVENRKAESNAALTSQKALKDRSKNRNLKQKSLDSAERKEINCMTETYILDTRSKKEIRGSDIEASISGALTVVKSDSIENSASKEVNKLLTPNTNKVIDITAAHCSKHNSKIPLKSCNLETAVKSIDKVLQPNENAFTKNTTVDDTQKREYENTLEKELSSEKLRDFQLNNEGFTKIESNDVTKLSLEHSFATLKNVFESNSQEVSSPCNVKRQVKNLIEAETKTNDQFTNSNTTFKIVAAPKDLNENSSKINESQVCNKTFNSGEAIKICGDQVEVVLKPIKILPTKSRNLTEKEFENSALEEILIGYEKQPQIKKIAIKSSPKLAEHNQGNIQQKQISDFEGLIQSSVIFKNKGENQYDVIKEENEKGEPHRSITVLDKSLAVLTNTKSLEIQTPNMLENFLHNSAQITNQVSKNFTVSKISCEHSAPSSKDPSTLTKKKMLKTLIKPKRVKNNNQKTVRPLEITPKFSKNLSNGSGPMPLVLEKQNANIKIPTKSYSKFDLETTKKTNVSEREYEDFPDGCNISATTQTTTKTVENLVFLKDVTVGKQNDVNKEPVSSPYDQMLVCKPLQNQMVVKNTKDIIIEYNPQQSFNESLSIVPIKVINPVECKYLEKPQHIPNEINPSNHTSKENKQIISCGINQYNEIYPKQSLIIDNTSALESSKNKFFKKIITKEINIEGEIVEVVKHIPCLNETQIITKSTDMKKETIDPFINQDPISSRNSEKAKSNEHNSINTKFLKMPLTQTNVVSNENNSLRSLNIQYQNTQQQPTTFELEAMSNDDLEKEVLPVMSSAQPDTYNTIPVLPSISSTFPTPSNFSGIFSKKTSSAVTAEDEVNKSRKKSQLSAKRKAYILPAASVLCNADNLENATKSNKKLHWELLKNETEMTGIEDDADIDATDDEQIKIKDEPLESVSTLSKQSSLPKRLTHQSLLKSLPSETETQSEDEESPLNEVRQRVIKCQRVNHTNSRKIKLNKHELPKNVVVGTHNANTFVDNNNLLIQKSFSIDMPKRQAGRPRKLDKKAGKNNEELTLCHKKADHKLKTTTGNNNMHQELPRRITTTDNNCLEDNVNESLVRRNISENLNNLGNSINILSTSVGNLEISDGQRSSRDSLKPTNSLQIQIKDCARENADSVSQINHKEEAATVKKSVEEKKISDLPSANKDGTEQHFEVTSESKQNNEVNLNSIIDENETCVPADQPKPLGITDKIIKTSAHDHDTGDHEVPLENSNVSENCLISRNDSETNTTLLEKRHQKSLLKKIHKSKSLRNQANTVRSLQDIGIKVVPPKAHLSSFPIPKTKKDVGDGIDSSWKLEKHAELNDEVDSEHLNENNQSETKEEQDKKSSNVARRKLYSADLYDASEKEKNIEEDGSEISYDQSECVSKIHKTNQINLQRKSLHSEASLSNNSAEHHKKPINMHRGLSNSCYDEGSDNKKTCDIEKLTLTELSNKDQTKSSISTNSENEISCGDYKKTLYNETDTCVLTEMEANEADKSCKATDESKGILKEQSDKLKLSEIIKNDNDCQEPLKVIKSFKMRKKTSLKITLPDSEKLNSQLCIRANLQEYSKNEKTHDTELLSNKDERNKSIESQSTLNKNLKETNDERKPIASVKLRRKSMYADRSSFCNDEHEKDTAELSKVKILLEKKSEDSILSNNNPQQMKPGSNVLMASTQETSIITRTKSIKETLLNSNIVDQEPQYAQVPKNSKISDDSVNTRNTQHRIMTRRKSSNQRQNLNSNKDANSLNYQDDKKYSEESKQETEKKTKKIRIEIDKKQQTNLNSQDNEEDQTYVRELSKTTEILKDRPYNEYIRINPFNLCNAKPATSNEILKREKNTIQTTQCQSVVSFECSENRDKNTLEKHDIQDEGKVEDNLEQNIADTTANINTSRYSKVDSDSTSALIQQTDVKTQKNSTTNPSQFPKPSRADDITFFIQKPEKDRNEQKSCHQKSKNKIELDSKMEKHNHMEIDSDSSIILTQQKAIQVRRKSTNKQRIFDSSSEDDEPLKKKATVIPENVQTSLTVEAKQKQRKKRVVKVLSTTLKTTENERNTSPLSTSHRPPLQSPTLNHPIFNREVSTQSTEFVSSLPRTPNQQDDSKLKEIDSKLHEIFQSPQYTAEYKNSQSLVTSNTTILPPPLNDSQSHIVIDETLDFDRENNPSSLNVSEANEPAESFGDLAPVLNNSEIKHLSLGSAEYRFEKVSDNVINLFISRKRKRKRNT